MLTLQAAREVDVVHEHVARVRSLAVSRVGYPAAPAAEVSRAIVAIA
jgi:hypothetical protein